MNRYLAIIAGCVCLLGSSISIGQIRVLPPEIRGALIDGAGITMSSSSNGMTIQSTTRDGVQTIKAQENGIKTEIVIDVDKAIKIKHTKAYGPDDFEKLEKDHPDLIMYLESVPKTVGNNKVELTLNVTSDYEASSADDLKERHPEIYKLYEKYSGGNAFGMNRMTLEFPDIAIPALEVRPPAGEMKVDLDELRQKLETQEKELKEKAAKRLNIDPDGIIQIEKVEEKASDSSKSSSSSSSSDSSKSSNSSSSSSSSSSKSSDSKKESKSDSSGQRKINRNDT